MSRREACDLISRRYAEVHGAIPAIDYSLLRVARSVSGERAALGYRRASSQQLFLEFYLDRPIEAELTRLLGRSIQRADIVEIGNLAADNAPAMVRLWADTANDLGGEAELAVAVLTRQLRAMFRRLGLTLHEIAPARPERLADRGAQWGSYYAQDPIVCAGFILEGQTKLAAMIERRDRKRA
jgi:hypothetical protein